MCPSDGLRLSLRREDLNLKLKAPLGMAQEESREDSKAAALRRHVSDLGEAARQDDNQPF
jgi:hypothetical protein